MKTSIFVLVFLYIYIFSVFTLSVVSEEDNVQKCKTPEKHEGICIALSNCISVSLIYGTNNNSSEVSELQKSCGNKMIKNEPMVCCADTPTEVIEPVGKCVGPDSVLGICKEIKKCNSLLSRLRNNPKDSELITFLKKSNENCGKKYSYVCCPETNDSISAGASTTKRMKRESSNNHLPKIEDGCGQTTKKQNDVGAWPWAALLGYREDDKLKFQCGGTLITNKHVLTAADCIRHNPKLEVVRLGEHDLTTNEETQHIDIPVAKTEIHENFSRKTKDGDIAVIYLEKSVEFSDLIKPICLPYVDPVKSKSYVDTESLVPGWGSTEFAGKRADVLQTVKLHIYNNSACFKAYSDIIPIFDFGNSIICAGVSEKNQEDACQGFAGASLMKAENIDKNSHYFALGIVSFGHGCGVVQYPGVYTNIKYYLDWIEAKISEAS